MTYNGYDIKTNLWQMPLFRVFMYAFTQSFHYVEDETKGHFQWNKIVLNSTFIAYYTKTKELSLSNSVSIYIGESLFVCICIYIYIYIYIYIRGAFNKFPEFFVHALKFVVDTWKFSMLFLYIIGVGIGIHPTKAWLSQLVNFKNAILTWGRKISNKVLF